MTGVSVVLVMLQQYTYMKIRCSNPGTDSETMLKIENPEKMKKQSLILRNDENILLKLIENKERDRELEKKLSHLPDPITKENYEAQLLQLRQYKATHIIYCPTCDYFRDARSHHCSKLNRCVRKMDQYCSWLDNCIGKLNQRLFLQYLGWTYTTIVWMVFYLLWTNNIFEDLKNSYIR